MKLAVIKTGGKQYKVKEGNWLKVEKINKKEGSNVVFDKVLLYSDEKKTEIGKPYVKGVKVIGKLVKQGKAKKITVIKYKHKIRYRRKKGHRQLFTQVKIEKIGTVK